MGSGRLRVPGCRRRRVRPGEGHGLFDQHVRMRRRQQPEHRNRRHDLSHQRVQHAVRHLRKRGQHRLLRKQPLCAIEEQPQGRRDERSSRQQKQMRPGKRRQGRLERFNDAVPAS